VVALSDFATIIKARLNVTGITNLVTECASTYVSTGSYYDSDDAIDALDEAYDLSGSSSSNAFE